MASWYKEFYITTPDGEKAMREALADERDGAVNRADIEKRLSELRGIHEDRCHISREQRKFLEGVLNEQ